MDLMIDEGLVLKQIPNSKYQWFGHLNSGRWSLLVIWDSKLRI
jgi:hypothetical protein